MKRLSLLLCILIFFTAFVSCKKQEKTVEVPEGCEMLVYTDKSVSSLPFAKLYDDTDKGITKNAYDMITGEASDNMMELALGKYDVALLPVPMAFQLYNKTEGNMIIGAITEEACISLIGNNTEINGFSDISNKKVYIVDNGSSVYSVFNYLLASNGLKAELELLSSYEELANCFSSATEEIYAVVNDSLLPYYFSGIEYKEIVDISQLWSDENGYAVPGEVICVNKKFANANPYAVDFLFEEYSEAHGYCLSDGYNGSAFDIYSYTNAELKSLSYISGDDMVDLINDFSQKALKYDIHSESYVKAANDMFYNN